MTQAAPKGAGVSTTVITGTFVRRKSKSVAFLNADLTPLAKPPAQIRRPANVARMLALAHHIQRALDQGLVSNRAAVARKLGLTEARVTQFMDLLYLAPDIQLQVLELEAVDGVEPVHEKALRRVTAMASWTEQRQHIGSAHASVR